MTLITLNISEELARHDEGSFIDLVGFNGHKLGACSIAADPRHDN